MTLNLFRFILLHLFIVYAAVPLLVCFKGRRCSHAIQFTQEMQTIIKY